MSGTAGGKANDSATRSATRKTDRHARGITTSARRNAGPRNQGKRNDTTAIASPLRIIARLDPPRRAASRPHSRRIMNWITCSHSRADFSIRQALKNGLRCLVPIAVSAEFRPIQEPAHAPDRQPSSSGPRGRIRVRCETSQTQYTPIFALFLRCRPRVCGSNPRTRLLGRARHVFPGAGHGQ